MVHRFSHADRLARVAPVVFTVRRPSHDSCALRTRRAVPGSWRAGVADSFSSLAGGQLPDSPIRRRGGQHLLEGGARRTDDSDDAQSDDSDVSVDAHSNNGSSHGAVSRPRLRRRPTRHHCATPRTSTPSSRPRRFSSSAKRTRSDTRAVHERSGQPSARRRRRATTSSARRTCTTASRSRTS